MSTTTEVKPAAEQVVLAAPAVEEVKEVSAPATEPITEIAPLTEEAKQPTVTHAEAGTLHTPAEAATTIDGTPAEAPTSTETPAVAFTEPTAESKEEKKEVKKEKVEKVKSEGKGFFAKLFGNISPKKEKKVKTPKTEQADPTPVTDAPVADAPAADATTEVATETEPKADITGVALAAEPAQAPVVIEEAPVASTSAVATEPETVKETETTAAASEPVVESKSEETTAEKDAKAAKAHRRISVRLTSFVKNIGKKDHTVKPEHKDAVAAETTAAESTPVVSDEAPKIAEPAPSEPISIEHNEKAPAPTTHAVAPPAVPVVAAAA